MKNLIDIFKTDSLIGKLCLIGFLMPVVAGLFCFMLSDGVNQSVDLNSGEKPWQLKIMFYSFIWFFLALYRKTIPRRCPHCLSANNSSLGKRELERFDGKVVETIAVDKNALTGAAKYESYDVPALFSKMEFSYSCKNCDHCWTVVTDIEVEEPSMWKSMFIRIFVK